MKIYLNTFVQNLAIIYILLLSIGPPIPTYLGTPHPQPCQKSTLPKINSTKISELKCNMNITMGFLPCAG